MADAFTAVLEANERYAEGFALAGLSGTAARGLAVITCMDSRIEPLAMLGLKPGDAKIMRNAGARVTEDVLRTLELATRELGVTHVAVVVHTDCAAGKRLRDQRATLLADLARIRDEASISVTYDLIGLCYDVATGRLDVVVPVDEVRAHE